MKNKLLLSLFSLSLLFTNSDASDSHLIQCPDGDITGDCIVNLADLNALAANWLTEDYNISLFGDLSASWQMTGKSVIVINEIHYKPEIKTLDLEYVELYNTSPDPINISGWNFSKGIDYTFPADTIINGGQYIVVAQDKTTLTSYYALPAQSIFGPYSGKLSNNGEEIRLDDNFGSKVDTVEYDCGFPWPTMASGEGSSIELINPLLDNDLAGNWRASGYNNQTYLSSPTPATANSVANNNVAPCIRKVKHLPESPHTGDLVTITAKVTDPDGVAQVYVSYQLVQPGSYIPATLPNYPSSNPETIPNPAYNDPANWTIIAMNDSGTNGDETADDNYYTITLPTNLQNHRNLIRYRITAIDNSGNSIQVPYNDDSQQNFAWFVYDSIPTWSGAINPASSDPTKNAIHHYSQETMSSLPAWHLISRLTDVNNCQYNSSYDNSSYYFSGTLINNGKIYDNIHYRIRGQYSTFQWGKNKWKIKFNPTRDFTLYDIYGNEYNEDVDTINLGSGTCPWWKYPHPYGSWDQGAGGLMLNEMLAYRLYQLAGVPASNTSFVQLRVIDSPVETSPSSQYEGDFWGIYIALEHADGSFLDERDMADGNIFRMDGGYNQTHQCSSQPDDGSDIQAFTNTINYSTPNEQWWNDNVDLNLYYSSRSVGIAINDADRRIDSNCIFYHNSETSKWCYLPWDLDLTFEAGSHYPSSQWENIQKSLSYSSIKTNYQNRGRELIDLLFNGEQTAQLVDEITALVYDGTGSSIINAERDMWDNHPRVSSRYKSLWYEHNEFLVSKDFAGIAQYMKQTVDPAGFTSVDNAYYNFGVPALAAEINNVTPAIPQTPTISYTGPANFPADNLTFNTSNYFSNTYLTFSAIKWRIAEIEPATTTPNGRELKYEINAQWEYESDTFSNNITVDSANLTIGSTYRVRCKMKDAAGRWSHWSAPVEFILGEPTGNDISRYLRVTELMYNPSDPTATELASGYDDNDMFEYIELKNTSSTKLLDLQNTALSGGITFNFTNADYPLLWPGDHILVVSNKNAFLSRYPPATGTTFNIAGEYTGNISNGGETININNNGSVFISFTYSDKWYPNTDNLGYSLVPTSSAIATEPDGSLDLSESWSASTTVNGSPGQ